MGETRRGGAKFPSPKEAGDLELSAYDYPLDSARIAQHPLPDRAASRLLVLDRQRGDWREAGFRDLPDLLSPNDLLVMNDARVAPARLVGRRPGGGRVEALLVELVAPGRWRALVKGQRLRPGTRLAFEGGRLELAVEGREGPFLFLTGDLAGWEGLEGLGRAPLPPYIRREGPDDPHRAVDLERYQTVYAREPGAVAAPTAGLHFTPELLERIRSRGTAIASVTLLVGPGTFLPVREERIDRHPMHPESWRLPEETARAIERARAAGGRVVAVGTTACRVLETVARDSSPPYREAAGTTRLFLHPPDRALLVDALVTNFHLPRSTLLMLVSALAGRELVLAAYAWAQAQGFRFYSYGDAMLVL